ncbi:hypothetical protein [Vibrio sp. SCSIO 43136]|uniref:hypothetical protein n=1 Tax=Vibrio sp. SCSIO 43136 TaxID=2819101 RepID=UPI0020755532|nr:hypothetical protein [Vibrio sp. SCSIO 43136]USD68324.1 hypothetical protein J4N39_18465 [Vibrio sp. SCSIO 43136]
MYLTVERLEQCAKGVATMPTQQFEQLRSKVAELSPQQLKMLRQEIEGKLDSKSSPVELTDEELQAIGALFKN